MSPLEETTVVHLCATPHEALCGAAAGTFASAWDENRVSCSDCKRLMETRDDQRTLFEWRITITRFEETRTYAKSDEPLVIFAAFKKALSEDAIPGDGVKLQKRYVGPWEDCDA